MNIHPPAGCPREPRPLPPIKMAPEARSHSKSLGVSTLSISVLAKESAVSSYLRRLSLRSLLKTALHRMECGPGGIRSRICDCDRVLCFPYTTSPE